MKSIATVDLNAAQDLLSVAERALEMIESEHGCYWAHAMEIDNPEHPWHEIVRDLRAAIAKARSANSETP